MQALRTLTPETARRVRQLLTAAEREGIRVTRVDSAYRSCPEQQALYESGVTPAAGCRSWHTWGRAVDLYIPGAYDEPPRPGVLDEYARLGELWKAMGGKWGGDFSYVDAVHFEWHPDLDIDELCPHAGAACGAPPWRDDRPLYARPAGFGLALAGAGIGAAVYLVRGRA